MKDLREYKTIYHLSHIDLDGYGCQFITDILHKNIMFYNTNYDEIDNALNEIFKNISPKSLFLVTDLNLNIRQAEILDKKSKELDFDILLIDHHITGLETSNKYDWYNLDTNNCATYITFEMFRENIEDPNISKIVKFIDTCDMWIKENTIEFQKATLLSDIIFKIKLDSSKDTSLKIKMIYFVGNMLIDNSTSVVEANVPKILTNTLLSLTDDPELQAIMLNENICSSYKLSVHSANDLVPFYSSKFMSKTVLFYKNISSSTFQYSSDFLLNKEIYKDSILVNINERNSSVSIRSRNKLANQLALKFGGGGHPNAAGANFKIYTKIEDILDIKLIDG